jgi:RNA polymerase sigma-70 factor (ECF subfamily)
LQIIIPLHAVDQASLEGRLTHLFEEFRVSLYRYLLFLVDAEAEAEDLTQDAFLRLHVCLLQGARIENAKAWLFRVAHHLAIDEHRRKRPESLDEDQWSAATATLEDEIVPNPERLAITNQRRQRLEEAVDRLSGQQRRCLHLRAEGFRHREIAEILGVSEPTVAENLRRGVLRLTREFDGT